MAKQTTEVQVKTYVEKIEKLIANDLNPRKINRKAYEALKKSLRDFPEMKQMREIIVDENFTILGGHQRIYALKDLGYTDVTIKQVTGLTEDQKQEFMIKDNNSAGEWDSDMLANHWDIERLEAWDMPKFALTGSEDEPTEKKSKEPKLIDCPNCGEQFEA